MSENLIESESDKSIKFIYSSQTEETLSDYFPLVLFKQKHQENAQIMGDGFQMLCQTAGTISQPKDIGRCPDNNDSYRIYGAGDKKRFYNYLVIEEPNGDLKTFTLYGFTSCHRFAGFFEFHDGQVMAVIDGESIPLTIGKHSLESLTVLKLIRWKRYMANSLKRLQKITRRENRFLLRPCVGVHGMPTMREFLQRTSPETSAR